MYCQIINATLAVNVCPLLWKFLYLQGLSAKCQCSFNGFWNKFFLISDSGTNLTAESSRWLPLFWAVLRCNVGWVMLLCDVTLQCGLSGRILQFVQWCVQQKTCVGYISSPSLSGSCSKQGSYVCSRRIPILFCLKKGYFWELVYTWWRHSVSK